MNISYKWLKEYLDFNLTPDQLSAALTSIGLETGSVETVESIRGGLRGLVVGKVLSCEPHPDSDHLHVTITDLGGADGPVQIVCGAPNVAAGQTVIVAPVGTVLYDADGNEFKIKRSKIRGVESLGMICAHDEIGTGTSHDGIIVLEPDSYAPGTPAREVFGVSDDYVLEVDLTPNRIDAASHYGVARDLAAYLSCHATPVGARYPSAAAFSVDATGGAIEVQVDDTEGCRRYCGVTIRGVKVGESPAWLRERLETIGMHPVNNVVDITNYILHGIGQPLHAFDATTLEGGKVVVRRAKAGDKFVTLDGVEHTLDAADLMICDSRTERCMAGVFGGLNSGVTEATTDVFLESACFHPTSVRRTARRHGISTDSSFRFERGVDPNGCLDALKIAAALIREVAGGTIVGPVVDIYPRVFEPARVEMNIADFGRLAGRDISADTIRGILASLECTVADGADGQMTISVPTYRVDVTRPCDVIEDVLRIYGYNNIAMSDELHASLSFKTAIDAADDLRRTIAEQLCGAGFNEILNNSLTAEAYYTGSETYPAETCVHLLNPLSQDLNVMRATLLYGGLETLAHNINRRSADLALYEFGKVYRYDSTKTSTAEAPLAPYSEADRLGLWLSGDIRPAGWTGAAEAATVFHLRAAVENVLRRAGIEWRTATAPASDIFAQAIDYTDRHGALIGRAGIVSDAASRRAGLKAKAFYAELDWNKITASAARHATLFSLLPKTQSVRRDLSLLLDSGVTMAEITETVTRCDARLIRSVELFDVYEGKNLPAGKKSYAIAIRLQDNDKTLQDKYIDKVMTKIVDALKRRFAAELR